MDNNHSKLDNETLAMLKNPAVQNILPVLYTLVVIISIPGNAFSLWIFSFHIKPKTPSVIFMINLSITDLVLACCLPLQIAYHIEGNNWLYGENLCSVVTVMFYANMYSSILTMTSISLERYLGVVYPMSLVRWRRKRYALLGCLVMWAALLAALSPLAQTDLTYRVEELNITTCFDVLKWSMLPNKLAWAGFLLSLFFLFFLIPFTVTVGCYIGIIWKLVQTSHRHGNGQKTRSIYLAVIVLLVFITCFAPNNFVLLFHMISRLYLDKSYYHIYKLTLGLSCLNNCIDPFIYYFASKEFYQTFMQVIGLKDMMSDSTETRRDSVFSVNNGRTMSARSTSNGPGEDTHSFLERNESVFYSNIPV